MPLPQISVITPAGVPHVVVPAPPSEKSAPHAVFAAMSCVEHAPMSAELWQAVVSVPWHAVLLQAACSHWKSGSSAIAHPGPFDGSARATQPPALRPHGAFVESTSKAPVLAVIGVKHPTQAIFAAVPVKVLQADCDPVVPVQAIRNPLICAMLHAEVFAGAA
jgi:hypothetical protein